jgi:hypothetical protein
VGGDGRASVVCGNIASAADLARQFGITLQRANCRADATGGSVSLSDVEIFVSGAAVAANRKNPLIAEATGQATASDTCKAQSGGPTSSVQRNVCWAKATSGKLIVDGVNLVTHLPGGATTTRRLVSGSLRGRPEGDADARCRSISRAPDQRDDCGATASGALFSLKGVNVHERHRDGSSTARNNIDVLVQGGNATGEIYCFNIVDGAGRVAQVNTCSTTVAGGDVSLHNVTVHVSQP